MRFHPWSWTSLLLSWSSLGPCFASTDTQDLEWAHKQFEPDAEFKAKDVSGHKPKKWTWHMFYAVDHVLWYIGVLQGPETCSVSAVRTINMFYGPNTCSMLHATVSTDHGTCSMDHRTVPFGHRPFWCMGSQPKPLNHLSSLIAEAGFLKHWKLCESRLVPPGGFLKHPHDKLQQQQQQQQDCSKDLKQGPNGSVLFI